MKNLIYIIFFLLSASSILIIILFSRTFLSDDSKTVETVKSTSTKVNLIGGNSRDKEIKALVSIAKINLAQITFSRLAQREAKIEAIKMLGRTVEKTQYKYLHDLTVLANRKLITLPSYTSTNEKIIYEQLGNQSQTYFDFDEAYCEAIIKGHQEIIAICEDIYLESNDLEIKMWMTEMLAQTNIDMDYALICQRNMQVQNSTDTY